MRHIAKAIIAALTALLILITGSPAAGAVHPGWSIETGIGYVQEIGVIR